MAGEGKEGKVKVWDGRKGGWVWVSVDSNAARGAGKGVTVQPRNQPSETPMGYVPSSIQVSPGVWVDISPNPSKPGSGGSFDRYGKPVVSSLGMTSPGDPRGAYRARGDIRGGDTGDTTDATGQQDLMTVLQGIFNPSGGSGSGSGGSKPTISRAALKKALIEARNEIGSAYDTAGAASASAMGTNPYAGFQAQATTVDPGLSALFQDQGVSSTPLEQMIATNREASGQRSAAMNDMYKLLAGQFDQQAAQQQAGISQQRAATLDDLLQNYAAILASGKVY